MGFREDRKRRVGGCKKIKLQPGKIKLATNTTYRDGRGREHKKTNQEKVPSAVENQGPEKCAVILGENRSEDIEILMEGRKRRKRRKPMRGGRKSRNRSKEYRELTQQGGHGEKGWINKGRTE